MDALLLPLDEHLVYAFLAGMVTLGLLIGAYYGIPAFVLWLGDRHRVACVDELVDLDRCDICLVVLTDEIAAITCDAHRYCGDCDDDSNRCNECSLARWAAMTEELA